MSVYSSFSYNSGAKTFSLTGTKGGRKSTPGYIISGGYLWNVMSAHDSGVGNGDRKDNEYWHRGYRYIIYTTPLTKQGSKIGTVTGTATQYPNGAKHTDGYWYVRRLLVNP